MKEKNINAPEIIEDSEELIIEDNLEDTVVEDPIVEDNEVNELPKKGLKKRKEPVTPPPTPKSEEYSFIDEADGL